MIERLKVGLGVLVLKENKVLLGKRKGSLGPGTWCIPGGHLEYFEKLKECALRETNEETGLDVKLIDEFPCAVTEDLNSKEKVHYITLYFRAKYISGEPQVMEPDKCEKWGWFSWSNLPKPLFLPNKNLIKQGYNPFK